jgi:signal transduction histidine kinase
MNRSIAIPRDPFQLMFGLEWVLIGIAILNEIFPNPLRLKPPFEHIFEFSVFNILLILGLGIIGLKRPKHNRLYKILFTMLEFGLMWLPGLLSGSPIISPALNIVIVTRSCLMWRWPGRFLVAGMSLLSLLLGLFVTLKTVSSPPPPPPPGLPPGISQEQFQTVITSIGTNVALSFGLALLFVLLLVNALLAERQSREQLAIAHDQLQQYALQVESQATLQERNRIAREIHDSLGHSLTAQLIQLENVLLFWQSDREQAKTFLLEAKRLSGAALQDVRQAIAALRAAPLKGQPPKTAIDALIKQFHQTTGIAPICLMDGLSHLPIELTTSIYRIVQEGLMNVAKHSAATQVMIFLQLKGNALHLLIEDNGRGFDPHQNTTGFGLQGMRERTIALGGQFTILSEPGMGCQMTAQIPLSGVSYDSRVVSRRSGFNSAWLKELTQRQFRFTSRG